MKPTFSFVILAVVAYIAGANAASCLEKTGIYPQFQEAQTACLKTLNLTAADIPSGKDLKEKHFNDRCLSSCAMQTLNVYNNGTIEKDAILEAIKSQVASDVYDKLAKSVEKCVEKATKPPKKDKDDKDKKHKKMSKESKHQHHEHGRNVTCTCRRAAKFIHCMLENDKEATC